MRVLLHITFGMALMAAAPAVALTPLPICGGAPIEGGFKGWEAWGVENGYVIYTGEASGSRAIVVLEHCASGKAVFADALAGDAQTRPDYVDNVQDALSDYVYSAKKYTLSQIAAGVRERGIKSRTRTIGTESCACATFYPNDRGSRKPYE